VVVGMSGVPPNKQVSGSACVHHGSEVCKREGADARA